MTDFEIEFLKSWKRLEEAAVKALNLLSSTISNNQQNNSNNGQNQ